MIFLGARPAGLGKTCAERQDRADGRALSSFASQSRSDLERSCGVGSAVIVIVLPIVLYPVAKSLWAAIDLAMRPLEPVEEAEAALHAAPEE